MPASVKAFDKDVIGNLPKWKELGAANANPNIKLLTEAASEAFTHTRNVIYALALSKQVDAKTIAEVISPSWIPIVKKTDGIRDPKLKNHIKTVLDGLKILHFYIQGDQFEYVKE